MTDEYEDKNLASAGIPTLTVQAVDRRYTKLPHIRPRSIPFTPF